MEVGGIGLQEISSFKSTYRILKRYNAKVNGIQKKRKKERNACESVIKYFIHSHNEQHSRE